MYFVEPNVLNCTGLAVGKDYGLADKLTLGSLELAKDRACAFLHGWPLLFHKSGGSFDGSLSLKDVDVVTSARQRYVHGTAPRNLENVSGAEMPVMLEGRSKHYSRSAKRKGPPERPMVPKASKAFRWQWPCLATPVNCTQTGWLLQG
jgi:hypothetical protein